MVIVLNVTAVLQDIVVGDQSLLVGFFDGNRRLLRTGHDVRLGVSDEVEDDTAEEVSEAVI